MKKLIKVTRILCLTVVGLSLLCSSTGCGKVVEGTTLPTNEEVLERKEFRGVWIASVSNLDWPSKSNLTMQQQQQEFIDMLDKLKAAGFNAVIVQVRPMGDALYPSKYAPWSQYLTGEQGKDPGYDPLEFMIGEVHKRDMEFHAWLNPYRITSNTTLTTNLSSNNIAKTNPELTAVYNNQILLNPGNTDVVKHVLSIVEEIITNYDIEAIHFDDYFYPYPKANEKGVIEPFPDQKEYAKYGNGMTLDDWRRNNVNLLIKSLKTLIENVNPNVELGISPFGIWDNISASKEGSNTKGLSSYSAIYADSKRWVEEEWVDYISPQIYWKFNSTAAPYDELVYWWSEVVKGTNVSLYIGQNASNLSDQTKDWTAQDIVNQIRFNRGSNTDGQILFRAQTLLNNEKGVLDAVSKEFNQ